MKKMLITLALVVSVTLGTASTTALTAKEHIVIAGGSKAGIYYQVALDVCKLVNEKLGSHGYTCRGQPAAGSVLNIRAMKRGWLDFAVIQSDLNWFAYNGEKNFKEKPYKGLRSVFSIHPETVMLVARADAGITSVPDLRGKRVNMGNPGSGTRANAVDVLKIYGMGWSDISDRELEAHEAVRALRRGKLDAFFFTVGNPWPGGVELARSTKIRMIPINAPEIKKLVAAHPYCVHTAIPGGVYEGVDTDVPTYALKATLVTSEKVSEKVVYNVVKTVFDNLDRFRTMHPAFATLQPQDMLQALSAPLHPGAIRYYKEKGWM